MEHLRQRRWGLFALCAAVVALVLCVAMPKPALADESNAYAVYNDTTHTLTFTHDSTAHADKSTGTSTDVPSLSGTWYVVGDGSNVSWAAPRSSIYSQVQTVVFDDTCASDKIAPTSLYDWFFTMSSLTSIQNIDRLDTSNVTDMTQTFDGCNALTSLDVSGFNTSNVTSMWNTFLNCRSVSTLDVSGWDTSNVQNMSGMFNGCTDLEAIDVSGWDTHNVTTMGNMFHACEKVTTLDLSNWDTSNVTDMSVMFAACHSLSSIEGIGQLNTQNVEQMGMMFYTCGSLTSLDLSHWRTPKVTNMNTMFEGCSGLETLDISGFDNSHVTNMRNMLAVLADTAETTLKLKTVAVGANWTWKGAATDSEHYALLPDAPTGDAGSGRTYTGKWADTKGPLSSADPLAADQLTASVLQTSDPYEGNAHVLTWGEEEEPVDYTLHYDANGGQGAPADDVVSVAPSQAGNNPWTVSSTAPTRTGYTFKEWNTKADGTGTSYDASATVALPTDGTTSLTLYAQWKHQASVLAYDANGGQGSMASSTGDTGDDVTVADNGFTRTGYTFTGWNTKADGTGTAYKAGDSFTLPEQDGATATLYAQWSEDSSAVVPQPNGQGGTTQPNGNPEGQPSGEEPAAEQAVAGTPATSDAAPMAGLVALLTVASASMVAAAAAARRKARADK